MSTGYPASHVGRGPSISCYPCERAFHSAVREGFPTCPSCTKEEGGLVYWECSCACLLCTCSGCEPSRDTEAVWSEWAELTLPWARVSQNHLLSCCISDCHIALIKYLSGTTEGERCLFYLTVSRLSSIVECGSLKQRLSTLCLYRKQRASQSYMKPCS